MKEFDGLFQKGDYKDLQHFSGVVRKFCPYMMFSGEPVRIRTLYLLVQ